MNRCLSFKNFSQHVRQVPPSYLQWKVGINCNLNLCGCGGKIIQLCSQLQLLSQLLKHRYHVMDIRLHDRHNVSNHFYLEAFLSGHSFPSLSMSCSSAIISSLLFFIGLGTQLLAHTTTAADIVQSYTQGFLCQQLLSLTLITFFSRASTGILSHWCSISDIMSCPSQSQEITCDYVPMYQCIMSTNLHT